ncbi:MAG: hydroxymethylpyrimidine/phosphomethylpyrimidine kinase, partial [Rhizobium sp.]|nr:hydroxymethylpyrimidine/phosphomethylpyrimidine kinase [Rhizobium sp.]
PPPPPPPPPAGPPRPGPPPGPAAPAPPPPPPPGPPPPHVPQAVRDAQNFTYESLKAAFRPGMGQYIPERFFWAQDGQAEGNA